MEACRTCDAEFKRNAVELARQEGNTVKGIAHALCMGRSTLQNWLRAVEERGQLAFPEQGKARLTPEQEEIKRLKREVETLRQERGLLKAAAVWFATQARLVARREPGRAERCFRAAVRPQLTPVFVELVDEERAGPSRLRG